MRETLVDEGQPSLAFVGSADGGDDAADIAGNIHASLGIDSGWARTFTTWTSALKGLRDSVEALGIVVVTNGVVGNNTHRKLDKKEFQGFVLVDDLAPFIFINGSDFKTAQMFTMAHELAHVWFGTTGVFEITELQPSDNETERACNRVAAEFLVPSVKLEEAWSSARQEGDPYQALARYFKVSAIVAARRLQDSGLIGLTDFLDFYREDQARSKSAGAKSTGGNFYMTQNARLGRRFSHVVVRAVREGRLLYREAFDLTGLRGKTFDRYAKELGFTS